jgi:protein subunit release factor B
LPATGLQVSCQRERQREKNRFIALRTLVEKIEAQKTGTKVKGGGADKLAKAKKNKARAKRRRQTKAGDDVVSGQEGEAGEEEEGEGDDDDDDDDEEEEEEGEGRGGKVARDSLEEEWRAKGLIV